MKDKVKNQLYEIKDSISRVIPNSKQQVEIQVDKNTNKENLESLKNDLKKILNIDVKIKGMETKPIQVVVENPIDTITKTSKKVWNKLSSDQSDQNDQEDLESEVKLKKELEKQSKIKEESEEEQEE